MTPHDGDGSGLVEELFVPALGMAMEEAILSQWLAEPGDVITPGQSVAIIETDKATVEITSASAGYLGPHLFEVDQTVPVGRAIAFVVDSPLPVAHESAQEDEAGADDGADISQSSIESRRSERGSLPGRAAHTLSPRERLQEATPAGPTAQVAVSPPRTAATPVPTQPAAVGAGTPSPAPSRRGIAAAVELSWTSIPHFAVSRECDVAHAEARLRSLAGGDPKVTFTDCLLGALSRAWAVIGGNDAATVGLSIDTVRGVTNVNVQVRDADDLSAIALQRAAAVMRGRSGQLTTEDTVQADVSLSNLGTHGVDWFTGIIPVGQSLLVTVGRSRTAIEGLPDDYLLRRTRLMWATANADHRHHDGADVARLLSAFAQALGSRPE